MWYLLKLAPRTNAPMKFAPAKFDATKYAFVRSVWDKLVAEKSHVPKYKFANLPPLKSFPAKPIP